MPIAPMPPSTAQIHSYLRVESGSRASSGRARTPHLFNVSTSGTSRLDGRGEEAIERTKNQLMKVALEARNQSAPLTNRALVSTLEFLMNFQQHVAPLTTQMPYMTWSAEGEIVLEWRRGERQLIFYIDDQKISFLKAWGADIYQQMDEGKVLSTQEVNSLWQWLKN